MDRGSYTPPLTGLFTPLPLSETPAVEPWCRLFEITSKSLAPTAVIAAVAFHQGASVSGSGTGRGGVRNSNSFSTAPLWPTVIRR
jgi:hypothetical protein